MNILGIDFGQRRVGLAKANSQNKIAFPFGYLQRKNDQQLLKELIQLIEKEGFELIVIGLPLSVKFQETKQTKTTKRFATQLSSLVKIPIVFENELFTSQQAQQILKEKGKLKKGELDRVAAQLILQSYLDKNHI